MSMEEARVTDGRQRVSLSFLIDSRADCFVLPASSGEVHPPQISGWTQALPDMVVSHLFGKVSGVDLCPVSSRSS